MIINRYTYYEHFLFTVSYHSSDWSIGPFDYILSSYVVHQNLEALNRTTSAGRRSIMTSTSFN